MLSFLEVVTSLKLTFMAGGTKLFSPVAPHKTKMLSKVWQGCNMKTYLMCYSEED